MNRTFKQLSLLMAGAILFMGCGGANNATCPAGQSMGANNVCTVTGLYPGQAGYGQGQYGYNQGSGASSVCTVANGQQGVQTASGCLPACPTTPGWGNTGTTCIPPIGNQSGMPGQQNQQQCAAGSLNTNMGCLPQAGCPMGSAFSQSYNQCIPATQGYGQQGYGQQGYGQQGGGLYFNYGFGGGQQQCPMGMYFSNGFCHY